MLDVVGWDDQADDREQNGEGADEDPVAGNRASATRTDAGVELEKSGDDTLQRDHDEEHGQAAAHPDQRGDARGD